LTLLTFPVLVGMYVHLAHAEEKEVRREFGAEYDRYVARVPAWFPRLRRPADGTGAARPLR
jgi:protein-S-isoprenylcysteine O-methyltransferase Ste14